MGRTTHPNPTERNNQRVTQFTECQECAATIRQPAHKMLHVKRTFENTTSPTIRAETDQSTAWKKRQTYTTITAQLERGHQTTQTQTRKNTVRMAGGNHGVGMGRPLFEPRAEQNETMNASDVRNTGVQNKTGDV